MNRRRFLASSGVFAAIALAGCSEEEETGDTNYDEGGDSGGGGNNDGGGESEPTKTPSPVEPITANPKDLLLSVDGLDGEGWEMDNVETDGNKASAKYPNYSSEESVMAQVTVYESVDSAASAYQEQYDGNSSNRDDQAITFEELDIAEESHLFSIDTPAIWFRDTTAVARVLHSTWNNGGDRDKAVKYATRMYNDWR